MLKELSQAGLNVNLVVVNSVDANEPAYHQNLTDAAAIPMFQDVKEVKAWDMVGASKDDMFVYDSKGKLAHYLEYGGSVDTNLGTDSGYKAVKALLQSTK